MHQEPHREDEAVDGPIAMSADGAMGEIVPETWTGDAANSPLPLTMLEGPRRARRTAAVELATITLAHPASGDLQTDNLLEAFANFLQVEVANGDATEDTIRGYLREVRLWVEWCHERNLAPAQVQRRDIIAYREHLKKEGIAVSTRKLKLSIVRRFYDAAIRHGFVTRNPAQDVRGGKDLTPPEEKIHALTGGALSALVVNIPTDTLTGKRDRAIIGLMALHGLRRVEVHRLNHENVETEGEAGYLTVWGKGNRIRRVYLRSDTWQAVQYYMQAKLEAGLPLDALFLAHDNCSRGRRISRRGLNLVVDKYLNSSALKRVGVSCHALRHTHGTLAIAGGARVEHLRDAMGHSQLATTSVYVKAVGRRLHNPANFIDVEL